MKKISNTEFIERANRIHNNKYDYSQTQYEKSISPVVIICHVHGVFTQQPSTHLRGSGCPKCAKSLTTDQFISKAVNKYKTKYRYDHVKYINMTTPVTIECPQHGVFDITPDSFIYSNVGCPFCSTKTKWTTDTWIQRANEVHNNRYVYNNATYISSKRKILITCTEHGNFPQWPTDHLNGSGCPKCSGSIGGERTKWTTDTWVAHVRQLFDNAYSYERVNYINGDTPVSITCKHHGVFRQRPTDHQSGRGCSQCSGVKRWNTAEFITRAQQIHGNKYNYDKAIYGGVYVNTTIICPLHGEFQQNPGNHINNKSGCHTCAKIERDILETKTTNQFIKDAHAVHGDRYDYSLVDYIHSHKTVKITCQYHGMFEQVASSHLFGSGCPICGAIGRVSKGEQEIADFVDHLSIKYIQSSRSLITPYELDLYMPDYNLAIEYCGLYWHSEQQGKDRNYHKRKHDMCTKKGIQLLTIFEDEWRTRQPQVKNKLISLLGMRDRSNVVYARNTCAVSVSVNDKSKFFDLHHIQGTGPGSINIGLQYNNELVACMSFIKQKNGCFYLNRYATSRAVVGGFSKLISHFNKTNKWTQIVSFADCRWSTGKLYEQTGWTLDTIIPPDYSYVNKNSRIHKFNYRRKNLGKLLDHFNPTISEWENCKANGVLRVWDCGKRRYTLSFEDCTKFS